MVNQEIISILQNYKKRCLGLNQIALYPNIPQKLWGYISDRFPEFNIEVETPLVFYTIGEDYLNRFKCLMVTDVRLYYETVYYPIMVQVRDAISIDQIRNFEINTKWWPLDTKLMVNGKKVGTIVPNSKNEARILSRLIKHIIGHVDTTIPITKDETKEYVEENLENSGLFTFAQDYFNEVNLGGRLWGFDAFFYGPYIPNEKLEQARQDYGHYDTDKEKPIIYCDNSYVGRFGSIESSGLILTNKYLYFKLKNRWDKKYGVGRISLGDIKEVRVKSGGLWGRLILNGGKKRLKLSHFNFVNGRDAKVLEVFIKKVIKNVSRERGY
ncbi:MAG: hypothetical protein ACM3MK_02025 [Chitinophagales bacterium]